MGMSAEGIERFCGVFKVKTSHLPQDIDYVFHKPQQSIEDRLDEIERRLDSLEFNKSFSVHHEPEFIHLPTKEEIAKYGKEGGKDEQI